MSIFSQRFRSFSRGFTLIELLVVMSIMVIVTSVLLLKQSKFDSSTLLRSLAYSVALSVRQAQVYGTSVFGTTTSSGVVYASGYGIYVSSATPSSYTLFADINKNGAYDSNEEVKVFFLNNGYTISDFCATDASNNVDCWKGGTPVAGVLGASANLTIVFKRPNPEACFLTNAHSSLCSWYKTASIQIQSAGGDANSTRSIYMNSTGQISVGIAGS